MPCLVALLALVMPRLVIAGLYFLSDWFTGVFGTLLVPLLGFLFLPTTLLWYSVVVNYYDGVWGGLQIVVAVIAVAIDLSPGSARR